MFFESRASARNLVWKKSDNVVCGNTLEIVLMTKKSFT